ncbi:transcriptional regulator [Lactobacillus rodentium]|uniref:Flavodoxin n=1 Tax=Lactobacillus rodentium TaxID=947835 RepID=A0A2Z6T7X0_9LACO|nr:flavodoxin [Lactobacillus rodentium]MCR1894063.1 transcriptional regulator [Lactobacillus rodentium]GBG04358.1 flavodoxin [Lactobacillus rodentium]
MKTLIIYYSGSGNTKRGAEKIHHEVKNSDLVEIKVPAGTFSADMYETNDIFKEQIETNQLPQINLPKVDFEQYDLILIGSPVWSGMPASPIKSFLNELQRVNYSGNVASFFTDVGQDGNYDQTFKTWGKNLNIIGTRRDSSKISEWIEK